MHASTVRGVSIDIGKCPKSCPFEEEEMKEKKSMIRTGGKLAIADWDRRAPGGSGYSTLLVLECATLREGETLFSTRSPSNGREASKLFTSTNRWRRILYFVY